MEFTEDLASIHGYLCSDGYVVRNPPTQKHKYYRIGLRNTNEVLLKDFQKKFRNVFDVLPGIQDGRCSISSKEIYFILTENQSFYSWHWTLPKLTKPQLGCWLRSYFDCDGWVLSKARQNRHIGLDTVNHGGALQIQQALREFGIQSMLHNHRYLFRLMIYGKENLIKFQKYIGFLHPRKMKRLNEAVNSYMVYGWNFPKEENDLKNFVLGSLKSKKISSKRVRVTSIKLDNLLIFKKHIKRLFDIESKIYGPKKNGCGSIFYELSIQNQKDVSKIENL